MNGFSGSTPRAGPACKSSVPSVQGVSAPSVSIWFDCKRTTACPVEWGGHSRLLRFSIEADAPTPSIGLLSHHINQSSSGVGGAEPSFPSKCYGDPANEGQGAPKSGMQNLPCSSLKSGGAFSCDERPSQLFDSCCSAIDILAILSHTT